MTGQAINRDANGCWYLPDGLRPHPATVKALIGREALVADQTDLLGEAVTAYRLNVEIN